MERSYFFHVWIYFMSTILVEHLLQNISLPFLIDSTILVARSVVEHASRMEVPTSVMKNLRMKTSLWYKCLTRKIHTGIHCMIIGLILTRGPFDLDGLTLQITIKLYKQLQVYSKCGKNSMKLPTWWMQMLAILCWTFITPQYLGHIWHQDLIGINTSQQSYTCNNLINI